MNSPTSSTEPRPTHAGGVVYRTSGGRHEMLLVRARPAPHDWVLPKGHIEEGESNEACARREIREEAGIDSEPEVALGFDDFTRPDGQTISVAFYLMRFLRPAPALEDREQRWATFAEAQTLLAFEGARRIVRLAEARLTAAKQPADNREGREGGREAI